MSAKRNRGEKMGIESGEKLRTSWMMIRKRKRKGENKEEVQKTKRQRQGG